MTSAKRTKTIPSHLVEHENDPNGEQRGYIKATDFSLPYSSPWSRIHDYEIKQGILRHVNCSYLSRPGQPPTLLALKQHAQSLCVLIQALNPTLKSAELLVEDPSGYMRSTPAGKSGIDPERQEEDTTRLRSRRNDAFDFLNDLSKPYANDDPNHHKPLAGLLNEVRGRHEGYGADYHCPLIPLKKQEKKPEEEEDDDDDENRDTYPYASHHNLVMHANLCLERLDHEFTAVGGLMGLLPTSADEDAEDMKKARSSLLGQWLLFTQHLVGRMHELERAYGNALDALSGEAAVPHQHLSSLGPDGRSAGREIAYPQDRYILVNSGQEIFDTIHSLLDKEEEILQAKAKIWRQNGVAGEASSAAAADGNSEAGKEYSRGIVPLTIPTRYYRLAGQGKKTIFVVPAWEHHRSVSFMRELEAKPTIVSCVQPQWPRRATDFEKKYNDKVENAKDLVAENLRLRGQATRASQQAKSLESSLDQVTKIRDMLLQTVHGNYEPAVGRRRGHRHRWAVPSQVEEKYAALVADLTRRAKKAEQRVKRLEEEKTLAEAEVEALMNEVGELREKVVDGEEEREEGGMDVDNLGNR